jgi:hypothetical protein
VTRDHAGLVIGFSQKVECETAARVVDAVAQRQAEPDQRIEQAMLRQFIEPPVSKIFTNGKIGDNPVVTACQTKISVAVGRHYPVTGVELCVGAESVLRLVQSYKLRLRR